tara:strand:- start:829 stop:2550 length:1722 start_codon:yes stop_codon:yes gene_type:complete
MSIFFLLKIIFIFFLNESKLIVKNLNFIRLFLHQINFFKYLIHRKLHHNILRDSKKIKILDKNFKFFKKNFDYQINSDQILITSLLNSKLYSINNIILGMNLTKILNKTPVALIKKNDFGAEIFMRSFGIKKFYYLDNENIFSRLRYLCLSINLLKNVKNIDDLLKFRYQDIYFGKIVYDHYLRFNRVGTVKILKPKFYFFLSQSLMFYNQTKKILADSKVKEIIQTENQFVPSAVVFQTALLNNCKVYCKIGSANKISARIYKNFSEVYKNRQRFSSSLFNLVLNNNKASAIRKGETIVQNRIRNKKGFAVDQTRSIEFMKDVPKKKIIDFTKEDLCKKYKWQKDKPIVMIFSNDLIDGVFTNSWNLYIDRLTWLRSTLNFIKTIEDINWIIKPHPNEIKNKVKTSTELEVKKYFNYNHIKLLPHEYGLEPLPKIIKCAVSAQGSVGYEYPALGVPSLICGESLSSGHGISIEPKNEIDYFKYLKNVDKIGNVSLDQQNRAKIFIYIYNVLSKVHSPLIPNSHNINFKYENFLFEYEKLIDNYHLKSDDLYNNLKKQIALQDRHTINYNLLD